MSRILLGAALAVTLAASAVQAGSIAGRWDATITVEGTDIPFRLDIGRDGRVKRIHAGFAAPASGEFHDQLKAEFTSTIERLLAEPASSQAGLCACCRCAFTSGITRAVRMRSQRS